VELSVQFFFAFFWPRVLMHEWLICPPTELTFGFVGDSLRCDVNPVFQPTNYPLPSLLSALLVKDSVTVLPVQLHCMALGLFASLLAPFGGFFASGIKRAYGIKDFDSIIPGHGGFMDRLDCQFLMALATQVYYQTVAAAPQATSEVVIGLFQQLSPEAQIEVRAIILNMTSKV